MTNNNIHLLSPDYNIFIIYTHFQLIPATNRLVAKKRGKTYNPAIKILSHLRFHYGLLASRILQPVLG